ncbi:MAG: ABC transporter substrate-binding protein, partial [Cellulomonadaceae bacterium]|nr:ABC transporter substrate-binding protein [Cellulomonadaceae bacterium]
DYTEVTLTPREGVTWSDGQKLTADDIAHTYQMRMDNADLDITSLNITNVAMDNGKVVVSFKDPMYVRQSPVLHVRVLPKHYLETIANPATDPMLEIIGTGPYTLTSFATQGVVLDARDDWWGGNLAVPQLTFVSYDSNTDMAAALASGEVDWAQSYFADPQSSFISFDSAHNKQWTPTALGIDVLFVNTTTAPFNSVAFRQAVNKVIDREAHREIARQNAVPPLTSVTGLPSPAGDPFISSEFQGTHFAVDLHGAQKILTDAGYTGVGSNLVDPDGNPVTFTLSVPQGWTDYIAGASLIIRSVQALGVTATIDVTSADEWATNVANGTFDATFHWTDTGATPFDIYDNTMGGQWLRPIGLAAGYNFGRFDDTGSATLLQEYARTTSDTVRQRALTGIQETFVNQVPAMPVAARPFFISYNTRHYTGWPDDDNAYIVSDFTRPWMLMVLQHLRATR